MDRAIELARRVGLEGLTIGRLADDLDLSKSGLFAHFRSKEALQVQVLDGAAARFVAMVLEPAVKAPRGEPRMRMLFERWLDWERRPGGCVFVQAAADLDDRDGPARDRLVELQRQWLDAIATTARGARSGGALATGCRSAAVRARSERDHPRLSPCRAAAQRCRGRNPGAYRFRGADSRRT